MQVKARREMFRAQRESRIPKGTPDYVLGHIIPEKPTHRSASTAAQSQSKSSQSKPQSKTGSSSSSQQSQLNQGSMKEPWTNCRLSRILVHPKHVWNQPVPNYSAGETPKYLLPGLSEMDKKTIFGALPHVSTALRYNPHASPQARDEGVRIAMEEQEKQSEMLMRIMDLRNASRASINAMNRQKVIQEFGGGQDTGSTVVQSEFSNNASQQLDSILTTYDSSLVALLTFQIRGLNEHILMNHKDTQNKQSIRQMVHKRARLFKYLKRKNPESYEMTLKDVGLDRRAVEGEIVMKTRKVD